MEEMIIEAYNTSNWDLLIQIMHEKVEMLEIEFALGIQEHSAFIQKFQLIKIEYDQGLIELNGGNLYFFINGGFIVRKNEAIKEKRNSNRSARKSHSRKAIGSSDLRSLVSFAQRVSNCSFSSLQSFLNCQQKVTGFYYNSEPVNHILKLNGERVGFEIMQKLKSYYMQKLKFLNKIQLLEEIPKICLQQSLEKFRFMKLTFNETLYSDSVRKSFIFVLRLGEIIIEYGKNASIIVKSPNMVGDERNHHQQARCLTQYCVCYSIEHQELENIFKKKALLDQRQFQGISRGAISLMRARYFCNSGKENDKNNSLCKFNECSQKSGESEPILRNISYQNHKKIVNTVSKQKKERVKQHFSNSLNEKYEIYATKAEKDLVIERTGPILYQMKPLQRGIPNYSQLNSRLKDKRLKKIGQLRQKLPRGNSSQTLSILKSIQQPEETRFPKNDCITAKIIKNLDLKIATQLNKRYGMRVYKIL